MSHGWVKICRINANEENRALEHLLSKIMNLYIQCRNKLGNN